MIMRESESSENPVPQLNTLCIKEAQTIQAKKVAYLLISVYRILRIIVGLLED
jgi:hypothetical protein